MRKVELLPTLNCEDGYGPAGDQNEVFNYSLYF